MRLVLAAVIPLLYWDGATKPVTDSQIARIAVPEQNAKQWAGIPGIAVEPVDRTKLVALPAPGVKYRFQVSSATSEPWVDTNAWRILRQPRARFFYDVTGNVAPLSAAEAFMWDGDAVVHTDDVGLPALAKMIAFLRTVEPVTLPTRANIGFVDDGTGTAGEVMKLLARRNLLFKIVSKPDPALDLNVQLGTRQYTAEQARDPYFVAQKVRGDLGDDKRLVRVFGSQVTVARLAADANRGRLHLLNYDVRRPALGLRIRVKGPYRQVRPMLFGSASAEVKDVVAEAGAIEFTVPQLDVYGVFDLNQ